MSLRKTFLDTAAMSMVNVVRLLSQFVAIPILSRILSPEDYGLVGMAMPFVLFAVMLADAGVGMSLVRTPASDKRAWATCFWLTCGLGAVLALLMLISAPWIARSMEEPRLTPIIQVLAAVVFVQSVALIPVAELQQAQRFKLQGLTEVAAVLLGIVVAVAAAMKGMGAWALVLQHVTFYGVRTVLSFWFSSFRPKLYFDLPHAKEHIVFGRDVLGVNVIMFFTRSVDNLVIGKVLAAAFVGVYAMAFQFARLPMMLVTGPLQYVFYSKLSRVKDDKAAVRGVFLLLSRVLAILVLPAMGMAAAAHAPVFTLLLSEKWAASGRIFMLCALACAIQAVMAICGTIRLVLGRTDFHLRATVETGVMWMVVLLSSVWFGVEAVALAYSVAFTLYAPRTLALSLPLIDCSMGAYARAVAAPAATTAVAIGLYLAFAPMMGNDWLKLLCAAALGLLALVASALVQKEALRTELQLMKNSDMH